jgi:L-ascorbate metabolism protein UlaG (beta-lactamase superfamily)
VRERVTVVSGPETFDAGLPVSPVGEWHAVIHEDLPRFRNSGYVVSAEGQSMYHPGDSFTLPGQPVDVLFVPVSAPWLKMSEAVDFARAVGAPINLAIHDLVASDLGLQVVGTQMESLLGERGLGYTRVEAGEELSLR